MSSSCSRFPFATLLLIMLLFSFATAFAANGAPTVLLISIDGLKPEAVLQAQAHGLHVPNLTQLVQDGAYASGVRGVLPTLTYPSHTTLLTGASPARHGIVANTTFDPWNKNAQGWYWYAEDIRVPTLWDAAHAAGLATANVYWPVSVGASIDYNLPQIWRTGTDDDLKLQRALSTPRFEPELVAALGRYPGGMEETVAEDEIRERFAARIIKTKHPAFMTVYFTGLDTEQHKSGPFSEASNAVLERIDVLVGKLRTDAEEEAPGRAYLCVVSDHGFASVQHDVNLYVAFLKAGLFRLDPKQAVQSWEAMPWPAGGSAAIMLAKPEDQAARKKTEALLQKLAANPKNGIDRILTREEIASHRGFPDADFFVVFKLGYELGLNFTGPLVSAPAHGGMHGYLPENPAMMSSFFLVGPGLHHQDLGQIDMRSIAPTLGDILGLHLEGAELPALALQK